MTFSNFWKLFVHPMFWFMDILRLSLVNYERATSEQLNVGKHFFVVSTGVLLLFSKAKQNLAHSYIYSSRSVSLFVCVCACYGNKLSFPASAEGQRSEGAVSGSYLFGQTLLVGPHSLIHATLFHSEGWRNCRAFVTSLNEGESWSGDQTNNENHKNYKNKVNMFSVKHGLMENQSKFHKNVIEWDAVLNIQYCMILQMTFLFCWHHHHADSSSRPTTCHLINSWRTAQHYWVSSFTC